MHAHLAQPLAARARWLPAVLLALACSESPGDPLVRPPITPTMTTATGAVACERSWTTPTSGDWNDASRWTPANVPTSAHLVCFTASGTYTVTGGGVGRHLYLSNGAQVTFQHTPGVGSVLVADSLTMQSTSRITVARCMKLSVEAVVIDGTLQLDTDPSTCDGPYGNTIPHRIATLENNGLLELDSAVVDGPFWIPWSGDLDVVNRGIVHVRSPSSVDLGEGEALLLAGSVIGAGPLTITGEKGAIHATVTWGATILPSRLSPTSPAALLVSVGELALTDTSARGAIDTSVDVIDGNIGTQMDVTVTGPATTFSSWLVNRGTLAFSSNWVTTASGTSIINYGAIRALSGTPFQFLNATSLENHGILEVTGELTLSSGAAPMRVTNPGSVVVRPGASLKLDNAGFEQDATGTVTGTIEAMGPNARLSGSGHVASLRLASGSTLSPGTAAIDAGSLSFDTLVVNAGATVAMDLHDPAVAPGDRLHVQRSVSLGGTLTLRTDNAYVGGVCGQLLSLLTVTKGATASGSFSTVTGTQLDSARAWRWVPGTTTYRVAGFDPRMRLSIAPAGLAVTEGGSGATTNVCLGTQPPSASVTVTPTPRAGQVVAAPSPVTFTTSNWAVPQLLAVSAIDDARAEGPHIDSVAFSLASADPAYRGTVQPQLHVDVADNDPAVDLALSLVSAPATAVVNGLADVRFRVTNAGPGNSTGATFTLKPMVGLTLDNYAGSVSCTETSGVLTCTVGALAAGASLEFVLLFRATAAGTHSNTARLAGRDFDPSLGDNALVWVITVS